MINGHASAFAVLHIKSGYHGAENRRKTNCHMNYLHHLSPLATVHGCVTRGVMYDEHDDATYGLSIACSC